MKLPAFIDTRPAAVPSRAEMPGTAFADVLADAKPRTDLAADATAQDQFDAEAAGSEVPLPVGGREAPAPPLAASFATPIETQVPIATSTGTSGVSGATRTPGVSPALSLARTASLAPIPSAMNDGPTGRTAPDIEFSIEGRDADSLASIRAEGDGRQSSRARRVPPAAAASPLTVTAAAGLPAAPPSAPATETVVLRPVSPLGEPLLAGPVPQRLTFVLAPERLGEVRVSLALVNGQARLRVVATTEAGFAALSADRDLLLPLLRDVRGGEGAVQVVLSSEPAGAAPGQSQLHAAAHSHGQGSSHGQGATGTGPAPDHRPDRENRPDGPGAQGRANDRDGPAPDRAGGEPPLPTGALYI